MKNGAAGEIRTPEVRHHWISNPAQWPGYATAARFPRDLRFSHEHDGCDCSRLSASNCFKEGRKNLAKKVE